MRLWFFGERVTGRDGQGNYRTLRYYVLVRNVYCGDDLLCESYGMEVVAVDHTGAVSRRVADITVDSRKITAMVEQFMALAVAPEELLSAVEDNLEYYI